MFTKDEAKIFLAILHYFLANSRRLYIFLVKRIGGDSSEINTSGLVRGATQMLVKEELNGNADDELIMRLDGLHEELENMSSEPKIVNQYVYLKKVWGNLQNAIGEYREHPDAPNAREELYRISEMHFGAADRFVTLLEREADEDADGLLRVFLISAIIFVVAFLLLYMRYQKHVTQIIYLDSLSPVWNRRGFENAAAKLLRQKAGDSYCIIKFDVDNFKLINTTYNYQHGDRFIAAIGEALSAGGFQRAVAGRMDADNFIVLGKYHENFIEDLQLFLQDAIHELDVSLLFNKVKFLYGAYLVEDTSISIKELISNAAIAHKAAKRKKADEVVWYNEELLHQIEQEHLYTTSIDKAIDQHEFQMYLQPQIDLKSMEVVSAESLVRWQRSDGTFIYPDSFIPLFEKTGLIEMLDFHMLELVCRFQQQRKQEGRQLYRIAVNISRVTLLKASFVERFTKKVDFYEIPHKYIEIEVTESSLNQLSAEVIERLLTLKASGFTLAMDDFGAGYSSLSSLSTLPVDILKLDRQFLWGIDENEKMNLIIKSTVELARSMNMKVICEGVEQQSHVDFLQSIGCDYAQGYYFSRPIPAKEFRDTYKCKRETS